MERNQKHDLFLPLALFADRALPIRECAAFGKFALSCATVYCCFESPSQ